MIDIPFFREQRRDATLIQSLSQNLIYSGSIPSCANEIWIDPLETSNPSH